MCLRFPFPAVLAVFFCVCASGLFGKSPTEMLLGPTGMFGSYTKNSITVTQVAEGSPAAGFISKGDVIVGAGSEKFGGDARQSLARAIDQAETEQAGGKLDLIMQA